MFTPADSFIDPNVCMVCDLCGEKHVRCVFCVHNVLMCYMDGVYDVSVECDMACVYV